MDILEFFPVPVGIVKLKRDLKDQELNHMNSLKNNVKTNINKNKSSVDRYVLDNKILCELKEIITEHLNDYMKMVFNPDRDVQLYITNSWINWTDNDTGHHLHAHLNSLVSCVLYTETDDNNDIITFIRPSGSYLFGNIGDFSKVPSTKWVTNEWSLPVVKNYLLIFPSQLCHQVLHRLNSSTGTRISLALNTWFKGAAGSEDEVSLLKF